MIQRCGQAGVFQYPGYQGLSGEASIYPKLPGRRRAPGGFPLAKWRKTHGALSMSIYVFVYGTLRSGEINDLSVVAARRGLVPPRRIGLAAVPGVLYDFGDWPGLVADAAAPAVAGEVYQVDGPLLALMDEIEEYAPDGGSCFIRRQIRVAVAGRTLDCHYYPIDPEHIGHAHRLDAADWVAYRLGRAAGA